VAAVLADDDGLNYDTESIRTEVMREEAAYHGVRVKIQAYLATAQMTTTLDFSFGDPHRSVIVELPELLGRATIRLACYPPELTLAEKIATMMSRRELNTRDRDFADVWVLSRSLNLPAATVRSAIYEVAAHRGHDVVPLSTAMADMPDRQAPYSAMLTRMSYQRVPPALWRDLLADVRAFVDPLIDSVDGELTSWDAEALRWT
jgi:Nucleotidyl transferase AbiEii toxin, Type IV TA system